MAALSMSTSGPMATFGGLGGAPTPAAVSNGLPSSLSMSGGLNGNGFSQSSSNGFQNGAAAIGSLPAMVGGAGAGLGGSGVDSLGLPGLGALGGAGGAGGSSSMVVVSELPPHFSTQELQTAFNQFGKITFCEYVESTNSGRVGFESPVSVAHAISTMNNLQVGDKKLSVVPAPSLAGSLY